MSRKGIALIATLVTPSCYSCYKPGDECGKGRIVISTNGT